MKSKNNIPAALLADSSKPCVWSVNIKLPKSNWAELRFSQKDLAVAEFNKIKSAGIFGGQWIESLELNEHTK